MNRSYFRSLKGGESLGTPPVPLAFTLGKAIGTFSDSLPVEQDLGRLLLCCIAWGGFCICQFYSAYDF